MPAPSIYFSTSSSLASVKTSSAGEDAVEVVGTAGVARDPQPANRSVNNAAIQKRRAKLMSFIYLFSCLIRFLGIASTPRTDGTTACNIWSGTSFRAKVSIPSRKLRCSGNNMAPDILLREGAPHVNCDSQLARCQAKNGKAT